MITADRADLEIEYAQATLAANADRRQLREALRERHISYAAFARKCGCSASNISAYLSGRHSWGIPSYIWRKARDMGLVD